MDDESESMMQIIVPVDAEPFREFGYPLLMLKDSPRYQFFGVNWQKSSSMLSQDELEQFSVPFFVNGAEVKYFALERPLPRAEATVTTYSADLGQAAVDHPGQAGRSDQLDAELTAQGALLLHDLRDPGKPLGRPEVEALDAEVAELPRQRGTVVVDDHPVPCHWLDFEGDIVAGFLRAGRRVILRGPEGLLAEEYLSQPECPVWIGLAALC